jgi:hypothetical protein
MRPQGLGPDGREPRAAARSCTSRTARPTSETSSVKEAHTVGRSRNVARGAPDARDIDTPVLAVSLLESARRPSRLSSYSIPTRPLVIVVHPSDAFPAQLFVPPVVQLTDCWGYHRWQRSAIDPRWWYGID